MMTTRFDDDRCFGNANLRGKLKTSEAKVQELSKTNEANLAAAAKAQTESAVKTTDEPRHFSAAYGGACRRFSR